MNEIGGYFNLELEDKGYFPHFDGILLNSGRGALEYILMHINDITLLWIPYYTCEVILEPLNKLNIPYAFYSLNEQLEMREPFTLKNGEYILATNYFGLMGDYITSLARIYGSRLIVDNAQALFDTPIDGINTIYSPRKFVGAPDGGVAITNFESHCNFLMDESYDRCRHLLMRYDRSASDGYADFKNNSHKITKYGVKLMSNLTRALLNSINYDEVVRRRINNFNLLHCALKKTNKLRLDDFGDFKCPMVYPYLCDDDTLRNKLIANKIYVATYWPNVVDWCGEDGFETYLMNNLIPLPIDQRYGVEDMNCIISIIL